MQIRPRSARRQTRSARLGVLAPIASLVLAAPAAASDPAPGDREWPWWRGPDRTGVSTETAWESKGRPLWKLDVGLGYACASVAGGRLVTTGFVESKGMDVVWCLDPLTGEELWTREVDAERMAKMHGGGTLTTPSIDGDRVFVLNRVGGVVCLDLETGEEVWSKDLADEHDLELPSWGFAASPLVLDDMVVLNVGKVVALDKKKGKKKWVSEDLGHAYSTPTEFELAGKERLAVFDGRGLAVLDGKKGKRLMLHPWKTSYDVNAATPIVIDDKVFISSGYNHGCALLEIGKKDLDVVWESKVMRNKMSGCVLVDDHLYGFDESIFKCIDLDGKEMWRKRGLGNGALTAGGDRLIALSARGELVVSKASPDGYEELSREKVLGGGVCWTSPVLAGGVIYCRDNKGQLVARDHRAAPSSGEF